MYSKKIMDRFANPQNIGRVKGANAIGKVGNAVCGDIMNFSLRIENGIVEDAKFKTFGCVAAIVSSDVACDLIKGKTIDEAKAVTNKQVLEIIGEVPANKIHCSVLAQEAIADAMKDYDKRVAKEAKKNQK